jgi:interferon gamma-inducible protein 30
MYFINRSFKNFIEKVSKPNLADIEFIPYGNAKEKYNETTKRWDFECQHKENECYGNLMETCAINLLGKIKSYEVLICIDKNIFNNDKNFDKTLDLCMKGRDSEKELIKDCMNSDIGNYYEHIMANRTLDHYYVPWILVDGVHDVNAENGLLNNMVDYLCSLPGNDCQNHIFNSKRTFHNFKTFYRSRCYNNWKK